MTEVKINEFAAQVGLPVERLLDQLSNAGIKGKTSTDSIADDEKKVFLMHLQKAATSTKPKMSLRNPRSSEVRQTTRTGAAKAVQVEVRRKRRVISHASQQDRTAELERLEAEKRQREIDRAEAEEVRKARDASLNAEKEAEREKRNAEVEASRERALQEEQKRQTAADELAEEARVEKQRLASDTVQKEQPTKADTVNAPKQAPAKTAKATGFAAKKDLSGSKLHVRRAHRGNVKRPVSKRRRPKNLRT